MINKLKKLATVLQNMALSEEADDVEDMIERYYGDWLNSLPMLTASVHSFVSGESEIDWASAYEVAAEINNIMFGKTDTLKDLIRSEWKDFEWAGSGMFRIALKPKGDSQFIIKVSKDPRGARMNESEFQKQLEFEGMFPNVHHHGEKAGGGTPFDWIVVEEVSVIKSDTELEEFFLVLARYVKEEGSGEDPLSVSNALEILLAIERDNIKGYVSHPGFIAQRGTAALRRIDISNEHELNVLLRLLRQTEPWFNKMALISAKLNLVAEDLGVENLGKDKDNNLMIIDSSFYKDLESMIQ